MPPVSQWPAGRGVGGGLNFGEHIGEGFDAGEIDVELGAAGAAEMRVGVVEAGKEEDVGAVGVEVAEDGIGSGETLDVRVAADGEDSAAADGDGLNRLRLVFRKTFAGVDDGVEEDDVGDMLCDCRGVLGRMILRSGLCGVRDGCGDCHSKQNDDGAHGRSLAESEGRVRFID